MTTAYKPKFSLKAEDFPNHCPATGEDLAGALVKAAEQVPDYHLYTRCDLYLLAATAYEIAASASLGHNRSARYHEAAFVCREKSAEAYKVAKAKSDADNARLEAKFKGK